MTSPSDPVLRFEPAADLTNAPAGAWRVHGARHEPGRPLEFREALQFADLDDAGMAELRAGLNGARTATVGGWFFPRNYGEQAFFFRDAPDHPPGMYRQYLPSKAFVNFCVGTDHNGFFMAMVNGYGPHVTLNELRINTWHQLAVVLGEDHYQSFYVNGELVHTDHDSCWVEQETRPLRETGEGPRAMLSMPLGGLVGEAWVYGRALSAEEIRADYEAKRGRYRPAPPGAVILLREMNRHPAPDFMPEEPAEQKWPAQRAGLLAGYRGLIGACPDAPVPLDPQTHEEEDCCDYVRRKVSIMVQPGDRMPAYVLIPKGLRGPVPAVICIHGSTSGAGKLTTVGLSGPAIGSKLWKNRAYAIDVVRAGMVAFAADSVLDGERVPAGTPPYFADRFYERFPEWSIIGKEAWDSGRAINYLQTLDFVDGGRIGIMGHSHGGHCSIFAAALDERIRAVVSNGPVSGFREHAENWGRGPGERGGQYSRNLAALVRDPDAVLPVRFHEITALIAPRPLLFGQGVAETRYHDQEGYAAVARVYEALRRAERVRYHWYAGEHDFPPVARAAAMDWLRRWLRAGP